MEKTPERRIRPRIQLKTMISVSYEDKLFLCELIDLNDEGVGFSSDSEFAKGLKVRLMFPGDIGLDKNEVEAQILRCIPMPNFQYKIAALLTDANPTYLENISKLISGQK